MEVTPAAQKKSRTLTLVATFVLGLGIGASLTYATLEALGVDLSKRAINPAATASVDPPLPPAEPVTAPPDAVVPAAAPIAIPQAPPAAPAPPSIEQLADVGGFWPARHIFIGFTGFELSDATREILQMYKPGGVVLRPENLRDAAHAFQLVQTIRQNVGLGLSAASAPLILFDPQNTSAQILGIDSAPSPQSLGSLYDEGLAHKAGAEFGAALAARGIGALMGPVLDVYQPQVSESWLASVAFGPSPGITSAMGLAFAEGVQKAGVLPLVKHFPGLGTARYTETKVYTLPEMELRALAELMFPFNKAAQDELPGIVAGHVAVPGLDAEYPTRPASLSEVMIRQLIRETWEFDGLIVADDVSGHPMTRDRKPHEILVDALKAGCDAVVHLNPTLEMMQQTALAMRDARAQGILMPEALERSKARLERLQKQLEPSATPEMVPPTPAPEETAVAVNTPAHPPTAEAPPADAAKGEIESEETPTGGATIDHTVAAGETLAKLVEQYGVTEEQLKEWNGLGEEAPKEGTTLKVHVMGPPQEEPKVAAESEATNAPTNGNYTTYKVEKGDTLSRVAARFNTTEKALMELNNLQSANVIQLGQSLKVPQI